MFPFVVYIKSFIYFDQSLMELSMTRNCFKKEIFNQNYNSLGLGIDIEAGGHVFQFQGHHFIIYCHSGTSILMLKFLMTIDRA